MKRLMPLLLAAVLSACSSGELRKDEPTPPPTDEGYLLNRSMALTLLSSGQPERALIHVRRLSEQEPQRAEPLVLMGQALVAMGVYGQARTELERAVGLEPTFAPAQALLGVVLDSLGLHEGAEACHREAIRLNPKDAGYRNNLGFSLYLQRRYAEARDEFEAALELDPTLEKSRNNLGFASAMQGDVDQALASFRIVGSEAQACNNLGVAYEALGDRAQALTYYHKAIAADPSATRAHENLERLSRASPTSAPAPEGTGPVTDGGGSL